VYNFEWHKDHGAKTTSSAETIIDILASFIEMDAVLDVGCGDGRWLSVCRTRGTNTISGVDGPWTDPTRLLVPSEVLAIKELSEPFNLERRYDLAMSLEVAEHVANQFSEVFVENLIRHSDVILFGAAIPYQGGFRHINEQWQSYWAKLFAARGFVAYDPLRNQIWDNSNVHFWYRQNTILYVNTNNVKVNNMVTRYIVEKEIYQLPLDIVHPEKYEAVASYQQIAFKPLIKRLPGQIIKKLASIALLKT
jgi:Methyltransferase domain